MQIFHSLYHKFLAIEFIARYDSEGREARALKYFKEIHLTNI